MNRQHPPRQDGALPLSYEPVSNFQTTTNGCLIYQSHTFLSRKNNEKKTKKSNVSQNIVPDIKKLPKWENIALNYWVISPLLFINLTKSSVISQPSICILMERRFLINIYSCASLNFTSPLSIVPIFSFLHLLANLT